jgi:CRP-like cAMP-binding protein
MFTLVSPGLLLCPSIGR